MPKRFAALLECWRRLRAEAAATRAAAAAEVERNRAAREKADTALRMPEIRITATLSVLRHHLGQRDIPVTAAAAIVKELALRLATGDDTGADRVLEQRLKRATGCSAADLAASARTWSRRHGLRARSV